MSTTVFPVTDQTATVALWSGMQNALDQGETDPLSSVDGDTDKSQLQYNVGGQLIDTDLFETCMTASVSAGEVWLFEYYIHATDSTTSSPGDDLDYRLSVPSGASATGINIARAGGTGATNVDVDFIDTTGTQVISGRVGANPAQTLVTSGRFVLVTNASGGTVSIDAAKAANSYSNTFSTQGYLIGRRIR